MYRSRSMALFCLSIIFSLSLTSCANIQVQQTLLVSANSADFQDAKNLIIMEFSGDKDQLFTRKLSNYLRNIKVDNKSFFNSVVLADFAEEKPAPSTASDVSSETTTTVPLDIQTGNITSVDSLTPVIEKEESNNNNKESSTELKNEDASSISETPLMSEPSAQTPAPEDLLTATKPVHIKPKSERKRHIKMAKRAGADMLILGSLVGPETTETRYTELRSTCQGSPEKCKDIAKIKVHCTTQTTKIRFTMKALNVTKGTSVFSEIYYGISENSYCDDKLSDKKELTILSQLALDSAIEKIRNDVAPSIVEITLEFMDNDDSGLSSNSDAKMLLDLGLQYAKDNNIDLACEQFRMANLGYGESPALFHNLGLCAEIKNDLDEAIGLYTQADRLSRDSNELIRTALQRVKQRIAKRH